MSLLCKLSLHSWSGCRCGSCGKTRDVEHQWRGCKCTVCGRTRNAEHDWADDTCRVCGCERPLSTEERAERWAEALRRAGDYRALAAYLCACSTDLRDTDTVWNAKRRNAVAALRSAGSEAVEAILAELEIGRHKDSRVAELLVQIADPRAVPLLTYLMRRHTFSATVGLDETIKAFVDRHPGLQGPMENVTCAVCGAPRAVAGMKLCYGKQGENWFCPGTCWSKRGRVVEHGIGTTCPHYEEGVCMVDGRDTGLCSLRSGHYQSSCHVYRMYPV